jgi:chemotaxis protein methyltransferase CheR
VQFHSFLTQNIVFARHNFVTDKSFNEFRMIICRNVLIYFNKALQKRVHELFFESLAPEGFLCIGSKEAAIHEYGNKYHGFDEKTKIFQRK